jgi:calcineurin-like phosphoesterase family protein
MAYWFTSDTHFGHAKILIHDKRPYPDIETHDQALIDNWNKVVSPGDVVYHLGDVAWHTRDEKIELLLGSLNGTLILIMGNHDHANKKIIRHKRWAKVCDYLEVTISGQPIILYHYRMVIWNRAHYGSWALHGHSHGSLPVNLHAKTFDVGTMCWDYTPISFEQVAIEMAKHTFKPVDGHRRDL